MSACMLCNDTIYDGESGMGPDGQPVEGFDAHSWCLHAKAAMDLCTEAMRARRAIGLPTPTSPYFIDPNKPVN